ncbi:hypothetical protein DVH24_027489 [Malus domestica]|uniref:B-like cyclin n=1 Tax=Malus domestica TaxID=3750 RepID=A0A498KPU2_MALDO|nr:hypothetical protein DVH24_027489 [Malus domestica]
MARGVPGNPAEPGVAETSTSICIPEPEEPCALCVVKIMINSKSDYYYVSFRSQTTIACAMVLCHRFYMRQSHAKNDWQTIATSSFFLACKVRETPRFLKDVVVVAFEMVHSLDSSALESIKQREVFNKQKELIVVGERLVLATIGFDLDIQLAYTSLVAALKSLNILPDLAQVALNFVNDCLRTSLCLQYKPHYIAAGSVALAAKVQKVKLPTQQGKVWWLEFDVSPKQLNEVIQRMMGPGGKKALAPENGRVVASETLPRKPSGIDEGGGDEIKPTKEELDGLNSKCKIASISETLPGKPSGLFLLRPTVSKIDVDRIRDAIKRRRRDKVVNKKSVHAIDDEIDPEAWIESELENGVELQNASATKKQRL